MKDFVFYNPVRLVFGTGVIKDLGPAAAQFGRNALIVTTKRALVKNGVLDSIQALLQNAQVNSTVFAQVEPNPRLSTVLAGAEICKTQGIDVLVALGGGSAIDCAKAIGFAVYDNGEIWELFEGKRTTERSLPIIAVTTVAASGSEMNTNCVITNEGLRQKYSTHFPCSFPKVSFVDADLHKTLPAYNTACGMVDTISHVMEKYFDGVSDTPIQDRIAEGVICTVIENEAVLNHPDDLILRKNLALSSIYALNGLNDSGRGSNAYDAHTIEMEISARYDIAHGAGLAIVHTAWLKHLCRQNPQKFVQFAQRIFGISNGSNALETGMMGIKALEQAFVRWRMPVTLKAVGVPKDDLESIAQSVVDAPEGWYLNKAQVYGVLCDCYE